MTAPPECSHEGQHWSPLITFRWRKPEGQIRMFIKDRAYCEACSRGLRATDFIAEEIWQVMEGQLGVESPERAPALLYWLPSDSAGRAAAEIEARNRCEEVTVPITKEKLQ